MTIEDKDALRSWEKFHAELMADVPMEHKNREELERHREYLERHPIEWIRYFFPDYAKSEFAPFQIRAIQRCIKQDEWYEVLSWARSLAKSTVVMFIVLYLALTGRKHNIMMVSATQDAAKRLLAPYRDELENNPRIKAYYGEQAGMGKWTEEEFVTNADVAFRAIGYGNAPHRLPLLPCAGSADGEDIVAGGGPERDFRHNEGFRQAHRAAEGHFVALHPQHIA